MSKNQEWGTPQKLFDELDKHYHFTLDPCATAENAKCKKYFTKEQDGLLQVWGGCEVVFCNPPYGRGIEKWVKKCFDHWKNGGTAVMLIPARTDTRWFHDYIYNRATVYFLKGRIIFEGAVHNAPFPSMIVVFG